MNKTNLSSKQGCKHDWKTDESITYKGMMTYVTCKICNLSAMMISKFYEN